MSEFDGPYGDIQLRASGPDIPPETWADSTGEDMARMLRFNFPELGRVTARTLESAVQQLTHDPEEDAILEQDDQPIAGNM